MDRDGGDCAADFDDLLNGAGGLAKRVSSVCAKQSGLRLLGLAPRGGIEGNP